MAIVITGGIGHGIGIWEIGFGLQRATLNLNSDHIVCVIHNFGEQIVVVSPAWSGNNVFVVSHFKRDAILLESLEHFQVLDTFQGFIVCNLIEFLAKQPIVNVKASIR